MVLQSALPLRIDDMLPSSGSLPNQSSTPFIQSKRWVRTFRHSQDVPYLSLSCMLLSSGAKDVVSTLCCLQKLAGKLRAVSSQDRCHGISQRHCHSCDPDQPHQLSLLGSALGLTEDADTQSLISVMFVHSSLALPSISIDGAIETAAVFVDVFCPPSALDSH